MKFSMNKVLAVLCASALLASSVAIAQIVVPTKVSAINSTDLFKDIPRGVSASTNVYASAAQLQSYALTGNSAHALTAAPVVTSCGTTAVTITGNDFGGTVTVGSSASTSCIITFATAYATTPGCAVTSQSQLASFAYTVSTTAITVTQTSTASNLINYVCVAQPGG